MKKTLLSLISITFFLCEASFTGGGMAFAASTSIGNGVSYELKDNDATLVIDYSSPGSGAMPTNYTSTSMPWNGKKASITKIQIRDGVTSIGQNSFNGCSAATTVEISPSVTSVGTDAFKNCSALTSVKYQYNSAGQGTLTEKMLHYWAQIDFANDKANPLYYAHDLYITKQNGPSSYPSTKVTSLTTTNMPSVASIKKYAFHSCTSLTAVTIAATATSIGEKAFYGCTGITKVTISDGSNLSSIGAYAFSGCSHLATCNFPNTLETIGTYAFQGTKFTTISIPSSVQTIEERAFNNCTSLTTINFDEASSLITIGSGAFYGSNALTAVDLRGATSLTTIKNLAFSASSSNTTLKGYLYIPATVTSIEANAFQYRTKVTGIVVLRTATDPITTCTASTSFSGVPTTIPVYVDSEELVPLYEAATCWSSYPITSNKVLEWECGATTPADLVAHLNVWTGALYFTGSGAMKDYDNSSNKAPWRDYESVIKSIDFTNVTTIGARAFQEMTCLKGMLPLHSGITSIGTYAFYKCTELTELDLGSLANLASIGSDAFEGCSKISSNITLPASITTMGSWVFSGCTMLSGVTFSDGWQLNTIPVRTFSGCSKLAGTITIPASVTSIGGYAFYNCSTAVALDLTKATALETIGNSAFYSCKALDGAIVFPASLTSIGTQAFYYCNKVDGIVVKKDALPVITAQSNSFQSMTASIPVKISNSSLVSNYSSATGWSTFTNISGGTTVSGTCGTNLNWNLDLETGALVISGTGTTMTDYNNSSNKAPWYTYAGCVKSLTTPASLQHIGNYAFKDCTNMTELNLSNDIRTIGNYAFDGCKGLTDITLPASITSIGNNGFNCTNLTGVFYMGDIDDWCSIVFGNVFANPLRYAGKLYIDNELVTTANITIANIKDYALNYNTELTTITLTNTETIGGSAFNQCPKLAGEIIFPNSLISIGNHAFKDDPLISAITFAPDASLTTIGQTAFNGCLGLRTVILPDNVEELGSQALYNQSATNIQTIYSYATTAPTILTSNAMFHTNAQNNATLHIPMSGYASYTSVNTWNDFVHKVVFGDCGASGDNVQFELDLTTGVLTISGSGAMANYASENAPWYALRASITSIVVEDGVTAIGNYAFEDCSNLVNVTISNDVASFGQRAFYNCTKLATLTLPTSITAIAARLFEGCTKLSTISIPNNVTAINSYAFLGCSKLSSVSMSNVASIGQESFNGCASLTNITLPETLTTIGQSAFKNCGLTSITIPRNVTTITCYNGTTTYSTFEGCSSLTTIVWNARTITAGFAKITYSGTHYAVPFESIKTQITSITFGPNVEAIPNYLCHGMNNGSFTSVTIPASVTSIGAETFEGCTSLTTVTSNAIEKPSISSSTFPTAVESAATLYVPATVASRTAYSEDTYWGEFAHMLPYIISFNMKDHGDAIDPICVNAGRVDEALQPADPTETGYTFGGWYSNEGCTTPFTFGESGTVVNGDLTLYALWTINSYDVTFDLQGHGDPIAPQSIDYNGFISEPSDPEAANYTFGGWYKEAGCSNTWDFSEDKVTDDLTLYAKWTLKGLALNENADNASLLAAYDGLTTDVSMIRSLTNAQYNTFCLPFSLDASQMTTAFGEGYDLEELTDVTYDGEVLGLVFTQREALEAGKPYLLQPANNVSNPSFIGVEIDASTPSDGLDNTFIEFHGVYSPTELTGGNKNLLFLGAGNELFWPSSTGDLKGFRAYFEVKGSAQKAVRARIVKKEDTATGIDQITNDQLPITNKFLRNGELLILRDGKTYNAQGMLVE